MPGRLAGKKIAVLFVGHVDHGVSFNVEKNVLCMYILDMDLVLARQSELGSVDVTKTGICGRKLELFNLDVVQEIVAESVDRRLKAEAKRRGPMPRSDPKKAPGSK